MASNFRGLAAKAVHAAMGYTATVHFPAGNETLTVRHHQEGAVIGPEGFAQAILETGQVIFDLAELAALGYGPDDITRHLQLTIDGRTLKLGEVQPVRGGYRAAAVAEA